MKAPTKPAGTASAAEPLKPILELPSFLDDLPRVGFKWGASASAAEAQQKGVLTSVESLDDLLKRADRVLPAMAARKQT